MPAPRKPPPGNPMWIEWLEEWAEEKRDSDKEHFARAIRLAIKSFKDCPVPIDHPSNAVELKHVGPVMVRYLTNKLIKYCNEEGLEMPTPRVHTFEQQAAKAAKSKKRKAGAAAAPLEVGLAGSSQGGPERLFASSSDDEMDVAGPSRPAAAAINTSPPKKRKKTKAYAPKLRSGPFAILVGLGSFGVDAWVTQEQIVERGDPFFGNEGASLTDKDNRLASNPAIGFSGWQSMNKTLVAKGLVEKKGRPLKYHITYEGWKIARKVMRRVKKDYPHTGADLPDFETEDEDSASMTSSEDEPVPSQTKSKAKGKASTATNDGPVASVSTAVNLRQAAADPNSADAPFLYCYLDHRKTRVRRRDEADVRMNPDDFTSLFLVEFRKAQDRHPIARKNIIDPIVLLRDETGPEGPTLEGFIAARHTLPVCPGFGSLKPLKPALKESASPPKIKAAAPSHVEPANASKVKSKEVENYIAIDPSSDFEDVSARENAFRAAEARAKAATKVQDTSPDRMQPPAPKRTTINALQPAARPSALRSSSRVELIGSTSMNGTLKVPDISSLKTVEMRPGIYSINLVLDSREKPGLSNKKLEKMLTEKGIPWQAKTLAMGDAVWIAKCRETGLEAVLDCCLERKRLDDLISSLKDGRYAEQKNRMKRSGISRLIYLVEETDKHSDTYYGSQIQTIKSSLQVIDDFTVHIAWKPQEAIRYLTMLTNTIAEVHKYTTLSVLSDSSVKQDTYADFISNLRRLHPATKWVMTYNAFQQVNQKVHTIGTNWAKMIASIDQMSMEKTIRVLERFPTPAQFFTELEEAAKEDKRVAAKGQALKKKEGTFGDCWIMRQTAIEDENHAVVRPIGQALSTHCWKLFAAEKY